MASAERSVGVRNGGAGRWFSSLASLVFTAHLMLLAGIPPKFPDWSNARTGAWFQCRKAASGVMIRIRYIMEYLRIGPFYGALSQPKARQIGLAAAGRRSTPPGANRKCFDAAAAGLPEPPVSRAGRQSASSMVRPS